MTTRFGGKFYQGEHESDDSFRKFVDMLRYDCKPNERVEIGCDDRGTFYRHVWYEED